MVQVQCKENSLLFGFYYFFCYLGISTFFYLCLGLIIYVIFIVVSENSWEIFISKVNILWKILRSILLIDRNLVY